MKFHDFVLDEFQELSINAINNNNSVVVSAPTGSGKTLIADYIIYKNRNNNKRISYRWPRRIPSKNFKSYSRKWSN